jgi:hypothetical protein
MADGYMSPHPLPPATYQRFHVYVKQSLNQRTHRPYYHSKKALARRD